MRKLLLISLGIAIVAVATFLLWPRNSKDLRANVIAASLPVDASKFARADGIEPLAFPRDHGPHDDFQTEWWYYTGNVDTADGRHFGYQLTFFRRAITPPDQRETRSSAWGTDQVYMAHFALTDVTGNKHYSFEKLERGAAGIAGAQAEPFKVWVEDWSAVNGSAVSEPGEGASPDRKEPVALRAGAGDVAIDFTLWDEKGPVLQGDRGYSRKGPESGNASYYYSLPRIATQGTITIGGDSYPVSGLSWMDHEYSTGALGPELEGWDWFSIQLDNNTELMLYRLRRTDGSVDEFSNGTLIAPDGSTRHLRPAEFTIRSTGQWRSPHSGGEYPSGWQLEIPSAGIDLTVTPYIADQEVRVSYNYWEGAAQVEGTVDGAPVRGNGYVELTGYVRSLQGEF